jgi:hypothetical protein
MYGELLSNFAFKFNLRRYNMVAAERAAKSGKKGKKGRGLHSFTLELNLSNSRTHS